MGEAPIQSTSNLQKLWNFQGDEHVLCRCSFTVLINYCPTTVTSHPSRILLPNECRPLFPKQGPNTSDRQTWGPGCMVVFNHYQLILPLRTTKAPKLHCDEGRFRRSGSGRRFLMETRQERSTHVVLLLNPKSVFFSCRGVFIVDRRARKQQPPPPVNMWRE